MRSQWGASHRAASPGSEGAPITVRALDQVGHRAHSPGRGRRGGWRASEWLRGHRPQRLCARREGPGRGAAQLQDDLSLPNEINKPGGLVCRGMGFSLEADGHGNGGKWGPGVERRSPARWFPLICRRGQGGAVPPPLPTPLTWGGMRRGAALGPGAAEGPEGRLMGSGTALPLAVVAPCLAQGMCSINTCWMISEMRGAWAWGWEGG